MARKKMKTRLLIIISVLVLFPISDIFAPPGPNEWSSAPYCPGGCTLDYLKEKWAEYYDYKGSEWMENKKQEMLVAMENDTLNEWLNTDPTSAHYNVHNYYFYKGEVLNLDGKSLDQVYQERFLYDLENNLKNNQFPVEDHTYINFSFLLVLFGGIILGVLFVIRRKRK